MELRSLGGGKLYRCVYEFISHGVSACAVPLFFVLSGYLFFATVKEWSIKCYLRKQKNRMRSLVAPYLFWNTLLLTFFFLVQTFIPQMTSGSHMPIAEYGTKEFLMAYWDLGEGSPICGPMWFVRDLILFSMLTIFLYPIISRKVIGLFVVILIFFLPSPINAIFYFALGAWLGFHKIDFLLLCRKMGRMLAIPYLVVLIAMTVLAINNVKLGWLTSVSAILGMIVFVCLIDITIKNKRCEAFLTSLSDSSFFVFAAHQAPLLMLCKLWAGAIPASDGVMISGYFILPFMMIVLCLTAYYIIKRYTPFLLTIMTGGR